jgi:hypothetical protein
MPSFRYRLIDARDGFDLGPFVSGRSDWQPGAIIPLPMGSFRVTGVVETEGGEDFRAYLVVEQFELNG